MDQGPQARKQQNAAQLLLDRNAALIHTLNGVVKDLLNFRSHCTKDKYRQPELACRATESPDRNRTKCCRVHTDAGAEGEHCLFDFVLCTAGLQVNIAHKACCCYRALPVAGKVHFCFLTSTQPQFRTLRGLPSVSRQS